MCELPAGLMTLIGAGIFWLGLCFVAGMRFFMAGTLLGVTEALRVAAKLYNLHQNRPGPEGP